MELAAALFRAPKGYALSLSLEEVREPVGTATLRLDADAPDAARSAAPPGGAIEVILDASGSMNGQLASGETKLDAAKAALNRLAGAGEPAPGATRRWALYGVIGLAVILVVAGAAWCAFALTPAAYASDRVCVICEAPDAQYS